MKNSNEIKDIFKQLEHGESKDLSCKENVWDKLEQKLDKNENKTKVFPIWKISGIAASFVIFATAIYFFTKEDKINVQNDDALPSITKSDEAPKSDEITKENILVDNENDSVEIKPKTKKTSTKNQGTFIVKSEEIKIKETKFSINFPTIQGVVLDTDGFPIPDAEIVLRGEGESTFTDENGKFNIKAKVGDVLTITDMFGISEDYAINKPNMGELKIGKPIQLEGVALVGGIKIDPPQKVGSYTVVKNTEYTTDKYEIKKKQASSIDEVLSGRVAGLSFSNNNGKPGAENKVVIRGVSSYVQTTDPLYVVDGVVMNPKAFNLIDPNKIQGVSVLKDASATALYGSRGANGVIVITTKGLTKKELRKIKRQNRKNRKENIEISYVAPVIQSVEVSSEEYSSFVENKFENPAMNPLSTFSVDVDKAAYSNIRRFLNNGQTVPKDAVRIEEMINYFHYNYPQPKDRHPFSINTEYSDAPWNPGHKLLKIGLQGKNLPVENLPNSNLVFLIDVSGSMNDENKLPLLKKSLELLVNNLRDKDKVSIVVYAGAAGMVLPPTSGTDKTTILNALNNLSAGGSTAGAAGIELAYQLAQENFIKNGNNRVILATDGDFNVGSSSVGDLETLISDKRKTGIFLTCLGYGMGNYKDNRMETLANKGNGNYAYIDNLQEANKFLVREFSGTLFTIAKDVKIQIEFNPQFVQSYRLIGYETRLLNDEDFVNDAIDAGEIGAGHQVTALYEIIPASAQSSYTVPNQDLKYSRYKANNSFGNELATVKFRYKKPDGEKSTEIVQLINNQSIPLKDASEDFIFATDVAWFGLKLRDSEYIEIKDKNKIIELGKQAMKNDKEGYKSEFLRLVELVK
ncbi:vWA domain-containing protein [Moheibacter sediminis]|uniref:Ca-activated chloride channel family protein n=1 Tax=Moheibacter sediminis TaxID=1434700 RepID=A0A1W1ZNV7_9FLAO|nr:VWA domain-containing protein [Moheibacter sediminis]SMC50119.1 Ca-activated chloride channel family protein [Moheibacter sediminis]